MCLEVQHLPSFETKVKRTAKQHSLSYFVLPMSGPANAVADQLCRCTLGVTSLFFFTECMSWWKATFPGGKQVRALRLKGQTGGG